MFKGLFTAVTAMILIGFTSPTAIAAQETATQEIEQYYDILQDAWNRAEELGFDGRFEIFEAAVRETFDMPYMAQIAIGRYWKGLDEAQKEELTDAMTRLSAATYAYRFDKYSGEKFRVLEEVLTSRGDLIVLTNIVDSEGDPVDINYLMRQAGDDWRIVDIYLKGTISELATRRSEFTSVMKRQGFDGLITAIDKKVVALGD